MTLTVTKTKEKLYYTYIIYTIGKHVGFIKAFRKAQIVVAEKTKKTKDLLYIKSVVKRIIIEVAV